MSNKAVIDTIKMMTSESDDPFTVRGLGLLTVILENRELDKLPKLNEEEKKLANSGQPIQAIKDYRTRCKTSLVEAKKVVEAYRNLPNP